MPKKTKKITYSVASKTVAVCLENAKDMLVKAGYSKGMVMNNPVAVVMLALKLADAKLADS